ncbi:MAG: ribonuclease HIII [Lentisphaeria bacterium]|nr:ribonuclease HIII [Lentisphaeria bacterium]
MSAKNYVNTITAEQAIAFQQALELRGWKLDQPQYMIFRAKKDKTTVASYQSGKLVIQGKGTQEIVEFLLEPEILGEATFGYEIELQKEQDPQMWKPHAGIDESGKGDVFGPLVVCCAYVTSTDVDKLIEIGVQDSKNVKSDKKMKEIVKEIKRLLYDKYSVVRIGNAAYNRMYSQFKNVNKMLAWAHGRALENLLEKIPECPRVVIDQFARNKNTSLSALQERGRQIKVDLRTKAESDIAVAAASMLARIAYVEAMEDLSKQYEVDLLKGASSKVKQQAVDLVRKYGDGVLLEVAKCHFKTCAEAKKIAKNS